MRNLGLLLLTFMMAHVPLTNAAQVVSTSATRDLSKANFDNFQEGDKLTLPANYKFTGAKSRLKGHSINEYCYSQLQPTSLATDETVLAAPTQFAVVKADDKTLTLESVEPAGEDGSKLQLKFSCVITPKGQKYGFFTGDMYWKRFGVQDASQFLAEEGITFQPKPVPVEMIGGSGGDSSQAGAKR